MHIRPVSDLRNKFPDIEKIVKGGEPVYLTKNGHGSMVVLSIDAYSKLMENVEMALDEADLRAKQDSVRYSHEQVFDTLRRRIDEG
ncbi:MAG: type II toxin-antitoxin system Phd/YefM family antitoxin [Lachnospiraceae bacterium]|nr:type II toxin-antitoxin system Phd/YefM family antitoxin [Lachnospiraceae bacterium]